VFNTLGGVTSAVSVSDNSPFVACSLSCLLAESGEPDFVLGADSLVSSADSESLNDSFAFSLADDGVDTLSLAFQYWNTFRDALLWSEPELSLGNFFVLALNGRSSEYEANER
jgi:hypothetical protein